MNFGQLLRILDVGVGRDDLRDDYPTWANQALHSIQSDFSWNCMRDKADVTMPSGESSVALPSTFKELTTARPPIFFRGVDGSASETWIPCDVRREEEIQRSNAALFTPASGLDVWLTVDGDRWYLNVLEPALSGLTFRVSHFRFLPELVELTDTNELMRLYAEMVEAKAKAVAFSKIVDPAAEAYEKLYELKRIKAQADDVRRWFCGRRLQMGG